MKKPNFFIVGAPKCGTTALARYLSEHPNVFMSSCKEPHYFADDFPGYRLIADEINYLALFKEATNEHRIVGEASVRYLFSQVAIKNIKAFDKYAKLVVMLRNPADMVYSYHSQILYDRDEEIANFKAAWQLTEMRKYGEEIPKICREKKLLYYDEIAKFGEQMERLLTFFSREQVLVIFYDDFSKDPRSVYLKVLDFLGLQNDGRASFPIINPHKQIRFAMLAQFTERTPANLAWAAMELKRVLRLKKIGVLDFVRAINQNDKPQQPLSLELRREISDHYRDDVAKLSAITSRDLSNWLH